MGANSKIWKKEKLMVKQHSPRHVLVVGLPTYLAQRLIQYLLTEDSATQVYALVANDWLSRAETFRRSFIAQQRERLTLWVGDPAAMDLGLSGSEYRKLVQVIEQIHHLTFLRGLKFRRERIERANLGSTYNLLDLAKECQALKRFVFWSTAYVCGNREGVVMEDDLNLGQGFYSYYEESICQAEALVRAQATKVPITIFRPVNLVGDSQTGEFGSFTGIYRLMIMI